MHDISCIPIFYHPTNILLLDDDENFLKSASSAISKISPYVSFTSPENALSHLNIHTYQLDTLLNLLSEQIFQNSSNGEAFGIHFKRLTENLSTPDRFEKVITNFIDQRMKNMNGLTFCEKAKEEELHSRFIMLTGQMDTQDAITAFNNQIINGYIKKEDPDLYEKLQTMTKEQEWQQFQEMTVSLTGPFSHILQPLYDKNFVKIFKSICKEKGIVEFYLLDASCSFLLIDSQGNTYVLLVRQAEDFDDLLDIASHGGASETVLEQIKSHDSFPYSPNDEHYTSVEGTAWDSLMTPMTQIPEREYFYALIKGPLLEIFSYDRYLKEIWSPSKSS